MYYTPPQILAIAINLHVAIYYQVSTNRVKNSVDPDQLAFEKPAESDHDLHCFINFDCVHPWNHMKNF